MALDSLKLIHEDMVLSGNLWKKIRLFLMKYFLKKALSVDTSVITQRIEEIALLENQIAERIVGINNG